MPHNERNPAPLAGGSRASESSQAGRPRSSEGSAPEPNEQGSNRLPTLASEIGTEHAACMRAGREFVQHAVEAGRRLIEAKALVPHGAWRQWLTDNVPDLSERTAQRYMRAAKSAGKNDTVSFLSLRHLTRPTKRTRSDGADDLARARALEAEARTLEAELRELDATIPAADEPELQRIAERSREIHERSVAIQVKATRETQRLMRELGVGAEGPRGGGLTPAAIGDAVRRLREIDDVASLLSTSLSATQLDHLIDLIDAAGGSISVEDMRARRQGGAS